jgi:hypothetical protein
MRKYAFTVAAGIVALALTGPTHAVPRSHVPVAQDKSTAPVEAPPRVFLSDGRDLANLKKRAKSGDRKVVEELKKLRALADKALEAAPVSVVHPKPIPAPSGDAHDYVSLSIYSWPDPTKKDGLPYVTRDGVRNPEAKKYDADLLATTSKNAQTLALAYYLTDDERYAKRAAELLRVWFLDPAKRMNPNMNFSGFVPGRNKGAGQGLTDARNLNLVVDAVGLLQHSKAWTKADQSGMENWYREFLRWLLTSELGTKEAKTKNNHATWYDVDVVTMSLFTGQKAEAKAVLEKVKAARIATQIEPDGSQPLELKRTNSFDYSLFNLEALFNLATLGDRGGVDLWHYRAADGRGIRKAFDFMVPYATGTEKWTHPQKDKIRYELMVPFLRRAANAYRDQKYEQKIGQVPGANSALLLTDLLYPAHSGKEELPASQGKR